MPNRQRAPEIHDIKNLQLPPFREYKLDNGIPVYLVEMGTQEVLKIEIVYNAGRPYEQKQLVGRATSRMLKEGTRSFDSAAIAEQVDFYGASLNLPVNLDFSSIVLYTLTRHFESLLPLLREMLTEPAFPEEELQTFKDNSIQTLQVELSKNDVLAYRTITELFFGEKHPYGYNSTDETYRSLTREDLLQHFQQHYHSGNCKIMLSGRLGKDTLSLLNRYLGQGIPKGRASKAKILVSDSFPQHLNISRKDSVQTAIRIGRRFPTKSHPDYQGFYILNTLLGGYFGSRLMTNIREDKGFTYNIFSTIDSLHYDSCFYIGTEVGNDFVAPTIKEIYREMDLLTKELVKPGELKMLRNHLLGSLLSMIDGPFNVASIVRTIVTESLNYKDFDDLVYLMRNISAEDLRVLAQRYLQPESMWEVIVGDV